MQVNEPDRAESAGILEVRNITFSYGRVQVLFGVSMTVSPGESLALLGTNGAGKSTLLKVICGLERSSEGTVLLDGEDISDASAERLPAKGLVLVPGGKAVFPSMTVSENLDMQALLIRKRADVVQERRSHVLDVFPRLGERMNQVAGNLSGGEQQQLALAKALLLDPKVLCIDELSLGLAPVIVQDLIATVRGLQATGISLVLVEQSLNIAASLCERAVFMEKGEVSFEGRTAELLERDDIARAVFLGGQSQPPVTTA